MGDFWRSVKANGLWTTFNIIDSKEFRAELYEAARENYIVSLGFARIYRGGADMNTAMGLYPRPGAIRSF